MSRIEHGPTLRQKIGVVLVFAPVIGLVLSMLLSDWRAFLILIGGVSYVAVIAWCLR